MHGIQLNDIGKAIKIYYSRIEMSNSDIKTLFGCGDGTAIKLKRIAKEKVLEKNIPIFDSRMVNTQAAFEAWGLDIQDLEKRYAKLKKILG